MAREKVTVRPARKADMETVFRMWARSYRVESPDDQKVMRARSPKRGVCVATAGKQIVAAGKLLPMRATLGGQSIALGGVASLATFPELRRRGYIQAVLLDMLRDMRASGYPLSGLYPFDSRFYHRYGWALADTKQVLSLPAGQLAGLFRARPPGRIVEMPLSDAVSLEPLRRAYFAPYNLGVDRDAWWWRTYFTHEGYSPPIPPRYLYRYDAPAGEPEGYALLSFSDDALHVRELATTTPRARAALLGFCGDFDSQVATVSLTLPGDDPLRAQLPRFEDARVTYPEHHIAMLRIVDIKALFADRIVDHPDTDVTFGITDDHAPWNRGPWRLRINDGHPRLTKTSTPPATTLSIHAATQLATGFLTPDAGHLTGPSDVLTPLAALADNRVPFHNDSY